MRLAHQLVLGASAAVALVMSIYGVTTLRQRQQLIGDALVRETETLAQAMQIVANSAIRNGQVDRLDRVLGRIVSDPDIAISAVIDSAGGLMAGALDDRSVCPETLAQARAGMERQVWADCGGRVRLVILPLTPPGHAIVIARRTTVMDTDYAASRRWIALTSIALAVFGSLVILVVVRVWLTVPLADILAGVRQFGGGSQTRRAITVPRAAGELQQLAGAFNEMVQRLDENQQRLVRETEERIGLERRLRDAELFAALGRLTGGVAHELGSPLGVIGVRAEAIQASPGATAPVKRHAEAIAHEVDRISRLVRDLIHVARRHGVGSDRVELGGVVRAVGDALRHDSAGANITIQVDLPREPVHVRGDATLLRHALYGVALNAVQALRGHAGRRELRIALDRADGKARLVVEDTGPGIPPEHRVRVFEPFFTTKDVGEGTGLGLAISSGIAEEHGGVLTLAPAAGGGVRAQFELSLATGPGSAAFREDPALAAAEDA